MENKDIVFVGKFVLKAEQTMNKPIERLKNSGNEDLVFVKKLIKDTSEIKEMIADISYKADELKAILEENGGEDEQGEI